MLYFFRVVFFFFKQKTAYEMRISDWSSDVCSSDLLSQGVDILVATPGRLLDLIDQRALRLGDVEIFVLDEADQMMDMGFIHSLRRVAKLLPDERQNLFFSATMPKEIAALAQQFLHDPVTVSVAPQATTAETVRQQVTFVEQKAKQEIGRASCRERVRQSG